MYADTILANTLHQLIYVAIILRRKMEEKRLRFLNLEALRISRVADYRSNHHRYFEEHVQCWSCLSLRYFIYSSYFTAQCTSTIGSFGQVG